MCQVGSILMLLTEIVQGSVLPKKIDWNLVGFDCMPFSANHSWALLTSEFRLSRRPCGELLAA